MAIVGPLKVSCGPVAIGNRHAIARLPNGRNISYQRLICIGHRANGVGARAVKRRIVGIIGVAPPNNNRLHSNHRKPDSPSRYLCRFRRNHSRVAIATTIAAIPASAIAAVSSVTATAIASATTAAIATAAAATKTTSPPTAATTAALHISGRSNQGDCQNAGNGRK